MQALGLAAFRRPEERRDPASQASRSRESRLAMQLDRAHSTEGRRDPSPAPRKNRRVETPWKRYCTTPFYCVLFLGLAVVLFAVEVFIPSFGIIAICGIGASGLGLYGFYVQGQMAALAVSSVLLVAFVAVVIVWGLRRLRFAGTLSPASTGFAPEATTDLSGKEGISLTPLRPAGMARIEGQKIDVVAVGGFVEKDRPVHVVETSGNRIVVRETNRNEGDSE